MESFWEEERINHKQFKKIEKDEDTSICIIGGGLTGLSCAYYLSDKFKVTVVEKDRICSHTSGHTTGKITSQHGIFYNYLVNSKDKEFAERYLEANEQAIKNIEAIIKKDKIDCDYQKEDAYVFTRKETEMPKIKEEQEAVEKLDKDKSELVKNVELPLDVVEAIKFKNQAQFHPIKYAYGLCNKIIENNGHIYENSKVEEIKKDNGKYIIYVNDNKIAADIIILATRYPIKNVPGYYFLKMYQSSSFAIVADVKDKLFKGMYISYETPTISFRTIKDENRELLLAIGYDYKTGTDEMRNGYSRLEAIVRKMYPEAETLYQWSSEDCISLDKIPYIGKYSDMIPNLYIATGFNKWGITSSNIAANIIKDEITGNKNKFMDIFESTRMEPIKNRDEVGNMLQEANKSIILSKFKVPKTTIDMIKIGEGKVIELDNQKVGVYKDNNGEIYKVKPICAHLGCELYFNNIDKTWECPCHGSKYTYDGKLIETPANKSLEKL